MYLRDTNVVSTFRKREQANPGVINFFARAHPDQLHRCVQVVGKIEAGIEKLPQAGSTTKVALYQTWLEGGGYGLALRNPFT